MGNMEVLFFDLVQERNRRETFPFVAIQYSNTTLLKESDLWQNRYEELKQQTASKQSSHEESMASASHYSNGNLATKDEGIDNKILGAKNTQSLREEHESFRARAAFLEEQHQRDVQALKESTKNHLDLEMLHIHQEGSLKELQNHCEAQERALTHVNLKLGDCEERASLAEQQYTGLKDAIRVLQEENDKLKDENRGLESRLIEEKTRLSDEVNNLNDMIGRLKAETEKLQSMQRQEEKRKTWLGLDRSSIKVDDQEKKIPPEESSRKVSDEVQVSLPLRPQRIIQAHFQEASCVRCDSFGHDIITGGSIDGMVKVWNHLDGRPIATLRGGSGNSIISCDATNGLVAGGGRDKTCRVWDVRTQRMLHLLVGHTNMITCVRFVDRGRGIVTTSKDRQIKVWDISKQTYRQSRNISVGSTANSIDIAEDTYTMVTGHSDGGLQIWDLRTGERYGEITKLHSSAITSVQIHPKEHSKVLTNGMDSLVKIIDIATCKELLVLSDENFQTSCSWSSSVFSPDGAYVVSGSSSKASIFVWNAMDGNLIRTLEGGHTFAGVCGIAWGREGMHSVDKTGKLCLWS